MWLSIIMDSQRFSLIFSTIALAASFAALNCSVNWVLMASISIFSSGVSSASVLSPSPSF